MKIFTSVLSALSLLVLGSCQKSASDVKEENNKKAQEFKAFISSGATFHAVDYYAESPIDYNQQDDVVTLETDLKKYIRDYIVDDDIIFGTNGSITFVQNAVKIGGNNAAEIHIPYRASGDQWGVVVDYIDDTYHPLSYYLHEKGSTYFILSWKRPTDGVRLFSKYEMVL